MKIMNEPNVKIFNNSDIVREYKNYQDVKRVAKVFCVSVSETRKILKEAGIKMEGRKKDSILKTLGMGEKDFYDSDILEK